MTVNERLLGWEMNTRSDQLNVTDPSFIAEITARINRGIRSHFEKFRTDQDAASDHMKEKRRILNEYQKELIGRLSLEERLKFGSNRF